MIKKSDLRWGVEKRLEFIELNLFWEGEINRNTLTNKFKISVLQASHDIKLYKGRAPNNIRYDTNLKRYLIGQKFRPAFIKPDPDQYLLQLKQLADKALTHQESWLTYLPDYCTMPMPRRQISAEILRSVVMTIKAGKSLHLKYQSLSEKTGGPKWRWITPLALATDGHRWHVRAYCHEAQKFKDFILSRFLDVGEMAEGQAAPADDIYWHKYFDVVLKPNPKLTKSQREIIALDYGMKKGQVSISVREALLYYFQTRLNLDRKPTDNPYAMPVVIANQSAFENALKEAS